MHVGGRGHLGGQLHRLVGEDALVVVLVRDHLDPLVDAQPLEDLARLHAEPVGEEDVAAVVPVEAVLAEAVGVAADVGVLLEASDLGAPYWARVGRTGESGRAGAVDDRVVVGRAASLRSHQLPPRSLRAESAARSAAFSPSSWSISTTSAR